jgi:hypothetical protein
MLIMVRIIHTMALAASPGSGIIDVKSARTGPASEATQRQVMSDFLNIIRIA